MTGARKKVWTFNSTPPRGPRLRVWKLDGASWEYHTENLRIAVHHHIDAAKDDWFVTCHDIRVEKHPLTAIGVDAEGLEDAKAEALAVVRNRVRKLAMELGDE